VDEDIAARTVMIRNLPKELRKPSELKRHIERYLHPHGKFINNPQLIHLVDKTMINYNNFIFVFYIDVCYNSMFG
jgi:hypothetical protein